MDRRVEEHVTVELNAEGTSRESFLSGEPDTIKFFSDGTYSTEIGDGELRVNYLPEAISMWSERIEKHEAEAKRAKEKMEKCKELLAKLNQNLEGLKEAASDYAQRVGHEE